MCDREFPLLCRERREIDAREKDRLKMEREKAERERRHRDEERLEREEKERQKNQVTQHFEESLRLAEQKVSCISCF